MIKYTLWICVLFITHSSLAQTPLATISMETKLKEASVFEVGDSLFVTYNDWTFRTRGRKAVWISSSGAVSKYILREMEDIDIFNVIRKKSDYYFYFVEKKNNKLILKAQRFNTHTNIGSILEEELVLKGRVIASFVEKNNLHILTFDNDTGELRVFILDGLQIVSQQAFEASAGADVFNNSEIEVYNAAQISSANVGIAKIKVIKDENILYLSGDLKDRTVVFKFSLPDYTYEKLVLEYPKKTRYTTFVSKDILYKLTDSNLSMDDDNTNDRMFQVEIFDLHTKEKLQTKNCFYDHLPPNKSYLRLGSKEHGVAKLKSFDPTTGTTSLHAQNWTISVFHGEKNNIVKIGAYNTAKSIGAPGNYGLLGFAISTAVYRMMEPPGFSKYIYFNESKDHSFLSDKDDPAYFSPAQHADDYEILMRQTHVFDYKGYTTFKGKLIAIYGIDQTIRFVRFE